MQGMFGALEHHMRLDDSWSRTYLYAMGCSVNASMDTGIPCGSYKPLLSLCRAESIAC